jgi:hypothetical protein
MIAECSSFQLDPDEADNGIVTVFWNDKFWEVTHLGSARILTCGRENIGSMFINFKKVDKLAN